MNDRMTTAALLALLALVGPGTAAAADAPARAPAGKAATGEQVFDLEVTSKGFQPANLQVKAGVPVRLRITRRSDRTCAKDVVVVGHVEKTELPLDKPVEVTFTPKEAGELKYGCSMDQMVGGAIAVR